MKLLKFIIKVYKLYKTGAKANDFPFSKYGFFGERLKGNHPE